jgi:hypothetical protein
VLGCLNGPTLNCLGESPTGAELPARCEFDVDFAVRSVLDVFFQVQLHDRVAAGCPST